MEQHGIADRLVTFEYAAKLKNTSVDTVRRRIATGAYPVFKDGSDRRRFLIRLSDVEKAFAPQQLEAA